MRKSTELDSVPALDEAAPRVVSTSSDTPLVILRPGSAGNDATYEDPAISDVEAWARHALAANGFGDGAGCDNGVIADAGSARPTSYELYHDARAYRSFTLGEIFVAVMQAVAAIARQALARHRQRRRTRSTYDALRQLDDRTLRDLGFDRSEIRSVVAEITGEVECTRVRTLRDRATRGGFNSCRERETNETKRAFR
jgi:uncharacterized protein YjiS (DUF1127 family)